MIRRTGLALAILLAACTPQDGEVDPATSETAAPSEPAATEEPPPIANPLEIGTQDARDDLYCAGLIFAAHPEPMDAAVPVEHARILAIQGLALGLSLEGTGKLIEQGAALPLQTGAVAGAWGDLTYADYQAGEPKIPLATCMARAEAAAAAYSEQ